MARGWRYVGLGLLVFGAAGLVQVARTGASWSGGLLGPATLAALAAGWALVFVGIVKRTRYHRRRMAG